MAVPSGIIVGWPSTAASIPSGWSRVTAYDDRYPRGVPTTGTNPGTNSGAGLSHAHTHNHTIPSHSHTISISTAPADTAESSGVLGAAAGHTHSGGTSGATAPNTGNHTSGSGGTDLTMIRVILIKSDGTNIPSGALAWFDGTSAPTDWRISDGLSGSPSMNGRYWRGAVASGDGGGTNTQSSHTHSVGSHTHTENSHIHTGITTGANDSLDPDMDTGSTTYAADGHTHTTGNIPSGTDASSSASGGTNSGSATPEPPFLTVLPIYSTAASGPKVGLIVGWDGTIATIPTDWQLADGTNLTPNLINRYPKGDTSGAQNTGGATTHTHTLTSHSHTVTHNHPGGTSSSASSTVSRLNSLATGGSFDHSHTVSTASTTLTSGATAATDTASNIPLTRTIAWIQCMSAGTQYLQSVAGTLGVMSGTLSRQTQKGLSGTLGNLTGTLSRFTFKNVLSGTLGALSGSLATQKFTSVVIGGVLGPLSGTLTKRTSKFMTGTHGSISGILTKQTNKILSGVSGNLSGTLVRQANKALGGTLGSLSGDIIRQKLVRIATKMRAGFDSAPNLKSGKTVISRFKGTYAIIKRMKG